MSLVAPYFGTRCRFNPANDEANNDDDNFDDDIYDAVAIITMIMTLS